MTSSSSKHALIERILATRDIDRGMRAAIETGIFPYTESRAYPWVLPYVDSAVNRRPRSPLGTPLSPHRVG